MNFEKSKQFWTCYFAKSLVDHKFLVFFDLQNHFFCFKWKELLEFSLIENSLNLWSTTIDFAK